MREAIEMREPGHGARLLAVSPFLVLLLCLGLQAHWGMGPFHANLFVLLAAAVLFVALPQLDAADASAAARVLGTTRAVLLPVLIAATMAKCTFDYWAFTAMSEMHIFALLFLCYRWAGTVRGGRLSGIAAFWNDSLLAVKQSRGTLYCFSTALLLASAAETQRRTAFLIFVNFPRPSHAPVSALVAGTLMVGVPSVVFAAGRVLYGLGMGHTCSDGKLCSACAMAAALAASSLLVVVCSVVYAPQALLLLTARGRPMTLVALGTIVALGLLWFGLWCCHDATEKRASSAVELRAEV